MKRNQKEYRCGVCNEAEFPNMLIGVGYTCSKCKTNFRRDDTGIFITKEPSDEWKKHNADEWKNIKEFILPPKYIETFEFK